MSIFISHEKYLIRLIRQNMSAGHIDCQFTSTSSAGLLGKYVLYNQKQEEHSLSFIIYFLSFLLCFKEISKINRYEYIDTKDNIGASVKRSNRSVNGNGK